MPNIVILGESKSGKTCFATRYVKDTYSEGYQCTIAATFYSPSVSLFDNAIKMRIWDTSGNERYASMHSMYSRDADAALIILNCEQSLEHNQKQLLSYLSMLAKIKLNLSVLISLTRHGDPGSITKLDDIKTFVESEACQSFKDALKIRDVKTHSAVTGLNVKEEMQEVAMYAYMQSNLPALNNPLEILEYFEFIYNLNSNQETLHLAEEAVDRLQNPTGNESSAAECILGLLTAESDQHFAQNLCLYLKDHLDQNAQYKLSKFFWNIGNRFYEQRLYLEAIEIFSKIAKESEFHKPAYFIKRACRLSLGGNKTFSPDDLNVPEEIEAAVIKVQSVYRAHVCMFNYRNYKKYENQVKMHMAHRRLPEAQVAFNNLQLAAQRFK